MANGSRTLKDVAAARGVTVKQLVKDALTEGGNANAAGKLLGFSRASIEYVMLKEGLELKTIVVERKR